MSTEADRKKTWTSVKAAMSQARGGRFETADTGASGLISFYDSAGKEWHMGGMNDAEQIVAALNGVLQLME